VEGGPPQDGAAEARNGGGAVTSAPLREIEATRMAVRVSATSKHESFFTGASPALCFLL
jgi:hypothetical protein